MEEKKKNILIVGNSATSTVFAKKLRENKSVGKIFIAPTPCVENDNFKSADIREDDLTGLLKFALENEIDLTIPTSEKALKADIVSFFQENGQNIFGPTKDASKIAYNKTYGKKFLYKIHAITSKFGTFDKLQVAEDWIKKAKFPLLIRTAEANVHGDRLVCPTISLASEFLNTLFTKGENEVLTEEFTIGHNFTVYYVTDCYSAVPITTVANYKFAQDGDGGLWTNGIGCFAPDYKISETVLNRLQNIVNNTLSSLEKRGMQYLGILGLDCTLVDEDKFVVNEFKPFFQDFDIDAVLNLVSDDLIKIMFKCIEGLFADEYETIKTNDYSSVSAVVSARQLNKKIKGLDKLDTHENLSFINVKKLANGDYLTTTGANFVLTKTASTLNRARTNLYEDLAEINFDGIRYRNDICK